MYKFACGQTHQWGWVITFSEGRAPMPKTYIQHTEKKVLRLKKKGKYIKNLQGTKEIQHK